METWKRLLIKIWHRSEVWLLSNISKLLAQNFWSVPCHEMRLYHSTLWQPFATESLGRCKALFVSARFWSSMFSSRSTVHTRSYPGTLLAIVCGLVLSLPWIPTLFLFKKSVENSRVHFYPPPFRTITSNSPYAVQIYIDKQVHSVAV